MTTGDEPPTHTEAPAPRGLQLFGSARWHGTASSTELPDSLPGYLVAYLAHRGDWVGRDALAALLWPERPDNEARHNLRANLYRARALLASWSAAPQIETQKQRVRLVLPSDVAEFRFALGRADWLRAVELHSGPLLAGCSFHAHALLDEWARGERLALEHAWHQAALNAARTLAVSGQAERAAALLLPTLHAEPNEERMQALLEVAAAAGCRGEALAAYQRFCRWLDLEFGASPLAVTRQLAAALTATDGGSAAQFRAIGAAVVPRAVLQPPRLIGRDIECARVADRERKLIAITGEPGVGKSRLLEEALPQARWLACREGQQQVPFAPVIEWIDDQRDALPALGPYRRDLARLVPSLADGELLPPADAQQTRSRLIEALTHVLEDQERALVIEDLQWSDAATRELIVHIARRRRVPLRLSWRSNEPADDLQMLLDALAGGAELESIELAPLEPAALLQLLAQLSGAPAGPRRFSDWLHARTGGNPFFVLQTLRSLFENGHLKAAGGGWASALDDITLDYSELETPPSVAELVARRLRGLSDAARRVLTLLAVCGDARFIDQVAMACALSSWDAAVAVSELERVGLLRGPRIAHDVVRQAVYGGTPRAVRKVLHAAVARHFETVLAPARIAEHCWDADDVAGAVDATVRAAGLDRRAGLHNEALTLLERALRRTGDGAQRACLHCAMAQLYVELNDPGRAERAARDALDAPALPRERAQAWLSLAAIRLQQGRLAETRQALDEAAASEPDNGTLLIERSKLATLEGQVRSVVPALEAQRDRLRRLPPGPELIRILTSLGAAYDELDDVARGLPLHREAYRLAEHLGARYAQVDVAVNLLWSLSAIGRNAEGVEIAFQALALGDYDGSTTLRNNLAWSLAELGRSDEARRLYEVQADGADPSLALLARARLLEMAAAAGDAQAAAALAERIMATLGSTEFYIAQSTAVRAIAGHGSDRQLLAALAYLRPQALDSSAEERLGQALRARGIDPAPWLGAQPAAAEPKPAH